MFQILQQINKTYFSKMSLEIFINKKAVLGFQYAPESLNVSKVCFDGEHESFNTYEESRKIKMLLNGVDAVNLEQCIQVDWLFCYKNQAVENLKLFRARYNDTNAFTQRIQQ